MQGYIDSDLTEKGIEQVKETSKKLKNIKFDKVFSSDLLRAKKTAEIINLERKLEIITTQALRERNFGEYEGKTVKEYNEGVRDLLSEYEKLSEEEQLRFEFGKGAESDESVATRVMTFLREIAVAYPEKAILIASHGGVMRIFLAKLGLAPRNALKAGAISNAGYIQVDCDGVEFEIKKVEGYTPTE